MNKEACDDSMSRERLAQEDLISERTDQNGNKWRKVYVGGGIHFQNWLEQCKELGEVWVEEADTAGLQCFEDEGEKLYRIWMKEEGRQLSQP